MDLPMSLLCGHCDFRTNVNENLIEHVMRSHPVFTCQLCEEEFDTEEDLQFHKNCDHSNSNSNGSEKVLVELTFNYDPPSADRETSLDQSPKDDCHSIPNGSTKTESTQSAHDNDQTEGNDSLLRDDLVTVNPSLSTDQVQAKKTGKRVKTKKKTEGKTSSRSGKKKTEPLRCEICDLKCSTMQRLKEHVDQVHLRLREHQCKYCQKKFSRIESLRNHLATKHNDLSAINPDRIQVCSACKMEFPNMRKLKYHIDKVHVTHKCDRCDKFFADQRYLTKHIAMVHDRIFEFRCHLCQKDFGTKTNLGSHIRTAHADDNKDYEKKEENEEEDDVGKDNVRKDEDIACGICKENVRGKNALLQHFKDHHISMFICSKCGMSFLSRYKYHSHCHGEPQQKCFCEICGKRFSCKNRLNVHISSVHQKLKPYQCKVCDKKLSCQQSLSRHMDAVHPDCSENSKKPVKCPECDKEFPNLTLLRYHKRNQHFKVNPVCEECGKTFSSRFKLEEHVNSVHKEIKPFRCALCALSFARKFELILHKQSQKHLKNVEKFGENGVSKHLKEPAWGAKHTE